MNQDTNKNISVWRGEQTPPTDYHLWEKSDGSIFTKVDDLWKLLTSPKDKENIDNSIKDIIIGTHTEDELYLNLIDNNNLIKGSVSIPISTSNDAGLMSSDQYNQLQKSIKDGFIYSDYNGESYLRLYKNNNEFINAPVPMSLGTHPGFMITSDKIKLDNSIYDLGDFNLSSTAEAECAESNIGLDKKKTIIRYTINGNGPYIIIQSLNELTTTQFLILKGQFYCRDVVYNSNGSINSITPWVLCNADGLGWNKSEHKYELWSRGYKMNGGFESVPEGTKNTLGLIDPNKFTIQSTPSAEGLKLNLKYNGESTQANATIPNDTSIKDVQIATMDSTIDSNGNIKKGTGESALSIVYILSDKTYKLVNISLSKFLEELEFGDGLKVDNHNVSLNLGNGLEFVHTDDSPNKAVRIHISSYAEKEYLQIDTRDGGLSLSGINNQFASIYQVLYTQHSQVILSVSPTIIERGVNTTINLSWKYLYNNQETTPEQLNLVSVNDGNLMESSKQTYTDTINDSKSYRVDSVNAGINKSSSTVTVNAYYPMYFGEGNSTYDSSIINSNNKRPIASNPNGSVNITFTGKNYLWLCIPDNMTINKVTSSGFSVPMESPVNLIVNGTYKCYRSTDTINAGTVNFVIS